MHNKKTQIHIILVARRLDVAFYRGIGINIDKRIGVKVDDSYLFVAMLHKDVNSDMFESSTQPT